MQRADALEGCLEGSEKSTNSQAKRWPEGKVPGGKGRPRALGLLRLFQWEHTPSCGAGSVNASSASAPRCRWLYDAPALLPWGRAIVRAPRTPSRGAHFLLRWEANAFSRSATLPRPSRPAVWPRTPCVSSRGTQSPRQRAALGHAGGDQVPDGGSDGCGVEHDQLLVLGFLLFCLLASTCGLSTQASAASRKQLTSP